MHLLESASPGLFRLAKVKLQLFNRKWHLSGIGCDSVYVKPFYSVSIQGGQYARKLLVAPRGE